MPRRSLIVAVGLVLCARVGSMREGGQGPAIDAARRAQALALRTRGSDELFNLDYRQARETFEQAIVLDPNDPSFHRFAAAAIWMGILYSWGAILADDYLGEAEQRVARQPPPADLDRAFRDHITRAISLAERQVKDRPRDADAHFQLGTSNGILASYIATIEGRTLGAAGPGGRAYDENERVLALAPDRKDAGAIVGMYCYTISTLSLPLRLVARLYGFSADRPRGLQLLEAAAGYPSDGQTNAKFMLIVVYNREKRYDDALATIADLQRHYPRNRLLWLEAGSTAFRAGRPDAAVGFLKHGLEMLAADRRDRAYGEEARWRLYDGAALAATGQTDAAAREFSTALGLAAPNWVYGRVHLELGRLADRKGDRTRGASEYRTALALCRAGNDRVCADEAKERGAR